MENEFEYKLNLDSRVLTVHAISTLVTDIRRKCNKTQDSKKLTEFKYLKEKLISADSSICITAGCGLLYLVRCDCFTISDVMLEVLAMVPKAK